MINLIKKLLRKIRGKLSTSGKVIISGIPVSVGRHTYGLDYISILSWNGRGVDVTIGSFCSISYGLTIFTGGNHRLSWVSTFPFGHTKSTRLFGAPISGHPVEPKPVAIGNDVWIGRDVTIMSGVKVGDGAVLAANAHVVKSVPPYAIVGGNPAKILSYRFSEDVIARMLLLKWWEWDDAKIKDHLDDLCSEPSKKLGFN